MSHWLSNYGSSHYHWQKGCKDGLELFHRPIGMVEAAFDGDGRHHEGRADMTTELSAEVKTELSTIEVRKKLLLVWAVLRNQHLLLRAKSVSWTQGCNANQDLHFVVDIPGSVEHALEDAKSSAEFLDDHFATVDPLDFRFHAQNSARVLNPASSLAKLFILPLFQLPNGHISLRIFLVGAHMIMDGLTSLVWSRNFVDLLNMSIPHLQKLLKMSIDPHTIEMRLPLPQEALYPPISGSRARQRWYWLITRILRHVRKPLPAGFPNPLARRQRQDSFSISPTYAAVLDYTRTPPVIAFPLCARTSLAGTSRLHRVCREAKVSVGAGCFALAALLMMEAYEQQNPEIPLVERKPFIAGFPLNPRAFFNHHNEPDSLMLAFCDGIILPFLSASLSLDGRLKLLARQAHRQLVAYQKRKRPMDDEAAVQHMGSRGAGRVLSNQYIVSLERSAMLFPERPKNIDYNPQGNYPARPNTTMQTCGVSSIGRRDIFIKQAAHNLEDTTKAFVASYRDLTAFVRPREGEFLIGIGGDEAGLWANVSIDLSTMDPVLVNGWKQRFETILDEPHDGTSDLKARI